jgi:anti-anti-sigma factor
MSVGHAPRFERAARLVVSVTELDSTVLLKMAGDMDLAAINRLLSTMDQLDLDGVTLLVMDLQDVGFLDLSALRIVFRVRDMCEAEGVHFSVVGPRGPAGRVLHLTGAHEQLDFVEVTTAERQH